jgi:hypothetical protein
MASVQKGASVSVAGIVIIVLVIATSLFAAEASGWSNGGISADPAHPKYGTHDWIADHALDWLPTQEKQFILDNKAIYLYGTELPDNNQAADGIGDTTKHHVYYSASGSLQDDAAAVRAREEYAKATSAFNAGNRAEAAKRLGVMAHYIADMAVFGHVMGSTTAWGAEQHHSDYEDYVETRTNSYQDDFNGFLMFDGSLSATLPYDAAKTLVYDTTFDGSGGLTCVWMGTHYNWSDATFKNRAGQSLNLAVNAVADVLHAFYSEVVVPEFPSNAILSFLLFLILPVFLFASRRNVLANKA